MHQPGSRRMQAVTWVLRYALSISLGGFRQADVILSNGDPAPTQVGHDYESIVLAVGRAARINVEQVDV